MSLKFIKLSKPDSRKLKYLRTQKLETINFLKTCLSSKNHADTIDKEKLYRFDLKDILGDLIGIIKSDETIHLSVDTKLNELKTKIEAELKILSAPSVISNEQGG